MVEPLELLLADGVIDEVFTRLKSGKEADIWLVRHAGEVVAAKVYKERSARSFKNNAAYLEGRRVRNTRTQRAMDRGSRFGQASAEHAWKAKESEALHRLHAAGVRVPKPVMFYEGVLLMEAVLDSDGRPAPRLVEAAIPREQAAAWYADLRAQAVKMLACDLVHGDLSPYNVLVAWNGPTIIDFPQVIGAAHNNQAERFFERDLENLRRFLAGHDPALNARAGDAREIWRAFVRRELTPDFVPSGKGAPEGRPHEQRHAHGGERRQEHRGERQREHGERRQDQREGPPRGGQRPPQGDRRGPPQRHGRDERRGPEHQERHGQRGRDPQRQPPPQNRQRQGPPEGRGGEPRRAGPGSGPQVTVVQRLPGVAPQPQAQPRRDGGEQGGGHGHHGRPHPHGRGRGHRRR